MTFCRRGFSRIAAIIVSRVSGQSFAEFTRERIFEPLGIELTARLVVVRFELIDVDLERRPRRGNGLCRVWNQRTECFAKSWSFLH